MNFELFSIREGEILLIALIIAIQLFVFGRTLLKIFRYKRVIPAKDQISISRRLIPFEELRTYPPEKILNNINDYPVEAVDAGFGAQEEKTAVVPIINAKVNDEPVFKTILSSLNTYLLKNKGTASDFNLVKDIIERHIGAMDNEIRITLATPLYLGLMGTMLGIIFGLWAMGPSIGLQNTDLGGVETQNFSQGISLLLSSVTIAMVASFVGILLTTLNSGLFYRQSKSNIEKYKNGFYTFLQTELLPVLSENVTSTMHSLQQRMIQFNLGFAENLNMLRVLVHQNSETIQTQSSVLKMMEDSDFSSLIKANITTFDKIQKSVAELDRSANSLSKFNEYLHQLNDFVGQSRQLNNGMSNLLNRTNNFQTIAQKVENTLDESKNLQTFLNTHFSELQSRGQLINNAVVKVDDVLDKSLSELQEHVQTKIREIRDYSINEQVKMEDLLKTNAGSMKAFFEEMRINMETAMLENSKNLAFFFQEMQEKLDQSISDNQVAFQKLNNLETLNRNFERFMSQQQRLNDNMAGNLIELRKLSAHKSQKWTFKFPAWLKRPFKKSVDQENKKLKAEN